MSGTTDKNVIERHPVVSTIIGTVLLAAIGGLFTLTYNTGYNGGAKDYETLNNFKTIDLPNLMKNLQSLAKDFRDRASLDAENQELKTKISETEVKSKNQAATATAEIRDLTGC